MYNYTINLLEQSKRLIELAVLTHNQETMNIPEEDYDTDLDEQERLTLLPNEIRKFKEHINDINGAIRLLKGDAKEMEKFFNQD